MKRQLALFSLSLVGCSIAVFASTCSIPIKNIEFCRDKGKYGAVCAYWLNAKETKRYVSLGDWNAKRLGMVCTSEAGMGNINAIIEKACQTKQCVEKMSDLVTTIEIGAQNEHERPSNQDSTRAK